ncbi:XdhC/CoxI family protein [uncultured Aquimarina sp.]|uniref:XdhC family protein n=1 Tax=uncultured Aquimarina sp. TaxID=575652 RepID=UPI002612DDC0|nr:XdhC/CoxI family protein [uncultured Aquimarina sp.]
MCNLFSGLLKLIIYDPMKSFELKNIINFYQDSENKGIKTVLVSLVGLDGSSYRKQGVRMAIAQDGTMMGAISGGCVEKQLYRSALSVFDKNVSKVISYDGRYKLGCEGFLYILIEPFHLDKNDCLLILNAIEKRESFEIVSFYRKMDEIEGDFGSLFYINGIKISTNQYFVLPEENHFEKFNQTINPNIQLVIVGSEHDAIKLCRAASFLGWNVIVITSNKNPENRINFLDAKTVKFEPPETINFNFIDLFTSVVLMTHSFSQDFQYLLKLVPAPPKYIGIIGSTKRKMQLENKILDFLPNAELSFLDCIYSPAGLPIGAETPEEIAISIIAEITSIMSNKGLVTLDTSFVG